MTDAELVAGCAALGSPARLKIVRIMARAPAGVMQNELIDVLGLTRATVSHHVKQLIDAGLVVRGDDRWYHLVPKAVLALSNELGSLP